MALMEFNILLSETWWQDTDSLWDYDGEKCVLGNHKTNLRVLFVIQMAIWTYTALSCKYLEEVRRGKKMLYPDDGMKCLLMQRCVDYFVMMTHHVITIILVALCWIFGHLNTGLIILFLHDVSDIPLDILKMANYLKLEGKKGFFITEGIFVVLLIDWIYFRIYMYPIKILKVCMFTTLRMCHVPENAPWYNPPGLEGYFIINALLTLLWCLHIWWGYLIFKILLGVFIKEGSSHKAANDNYEGASSDSDKED